MEGRAAVSVAANGRKIDPVGPCWKPPRPRCCLRSTMAAACCFDFGSGEDRRQSPAISSARGTLRRNLGPALPELGVREAFFVSAEGDGGEARFLDAVVLSMFGRAPACSPSSPSSSFRCRQRSENGSCPKATAVKLASSTRWYCPCSAELRRAPRLLHRRRRGTEQVALAGSGAGRCLVSHKLLFATTLQSN